MLKLVLKLKQLSPKFWFVFLTIAVGTMCVSATKTILFSLMLSEFGASITPTMNIVNGCIILLFSIVLVSGKKTGGLEVVRRQKLWLALFLGVLYANLFLRLPIPFLLLSFILLNMVVFSFNSQINIAMSKIFGVAELKTVSINLGLAFSIGSIIGDGSLFFLTALVGNNNTLLFLIGLLALSGFLLGRLALVYRNELSGKTKALANLLQEVLIENAPGTEARSTTFEAFSFLTAWQKLKQSLLNIKTNTIIRFIIILSILQLVSFTFYKYGFDTIVSTQFTGAALTQFLSFIGVLGSCISILFRFFLQKRLMSLFSFSRSYLLQGVVLLSVMLSLAVLTWIHVPNLYILVAAGYILSNVLDRVISTSSHFFYILVPKEKRDSARTFADGIGNAIATILSSSLVLFLVKTLPFQWILNISLLPISIYMILAMLLARIAYQTIHQVFENGDTAHQQEMISVVAEGRGKEVVPYLKKMYATASPEIKIRIIQSMGEIRGKPVSTFLHGLFFKEPVHLKQNILTSLAKFRGNKNYLLFYLVYEKISVKYLQAMLEMLVRKRHQIRHVIARELLPHPDDRIKILAIMALEEIGDTDHVREIAKYTHPDTPLRLQEQALVSLYKLVPQIRPKVKERIDWLLAQEDETPRIVGLRLISRLRLKEYRWQMLQHIEHHPNALLKSVALRGLSRLDEEMSFRYFAYFLSRNTGNVALHAKTFSKLSPRIRKNIISELAKYPVEAIDLAIKNLFPYREHIKTELQLLYAAIPGKFLKQS